MLEEIRNVRQFAGEGSRRWFADESFDLIVWFKFHPGETDEQIIGFEFCYDKNGKERALSWRAQGGFIHDFVDDGETPGYANMTPVLKTGGQFDISVIDRFQNASKHIEQAIVGVVLEKLHEYCEKQKKQSPCATMKRF
jgi:hypothetical protein